MIDNNNLPIIKKAATSQSSNKPVDWKQFQVIAKEKFVAHFAKSLNISESCREANIDFKTYKNWLAQDGEFNKEVQDALELAVNNLYAEGYRRSYKGVLRPLIIKGQLATDKDGKVIYMSHYSDALLTLYLKSHMKDIFGDKQQAGEQPNTLPPDMIDTTNKLVLDPSWLRDETLEMIREDIDLHEKSVVASDNKAL